MKKQILLTALSVLIVFASVVSAGSKQDQEIKQDNKQINSTIVAYNNLSMEIDYWHDASLKGNKKATSKHKQMIHQIISDDIKSNRQAISYAKLNASYSKEEVQFSSTHGSKSQLTEDESIFRSKKLLFVSLKKSKSFAYSYRLFADYLHLLDQELAENKVEFAGDASDTKVDAGQIRQIK